MVLSSESPRGPTAHVAVTGAAALTRCPKRRVPHCLSLSPPQIHIDIPRMSPEALLLQPGVTEVRAGVRAPLRC